MYQYMFKISFVVYVSKFCIYVISVRFKLLNYN